MKERKFLLKDILLIDDNNYINYLNKSLLDALRVAENVVTVNDGVDALALIKKLLPSKSLPDLIFLDIIMPTIDGIEFMEAFRAINDANGEKSKVVVLTSCGREMDLNKLKSLGVDELLYKPLTSKKIQNILTKFFSH